MSAAVAVVAESGLDLRAAADAARGVGDGLPLVAFVVGRDDALISAATTAEADRIVVLDAEALAPRLAETSAAALAEAGRRHDVELIVLPATAHWREVAAQLTVHLGGACATDVLELRRSDEGLLADRLLYGGVAIATVALLRRPAIVTMALPAADAATAVPAGAVEVEPVPIPTPPKKLLDRALLEPVADLGQARRIVAAGRGLRAREDLRLVEDLAAALDAEIACSRPLAEDLRWLPPERLVGLTGATVKPDLYVAVGISGQIQHLVGMRDSGVIVAVNSNPAAPIFQVADFGLVADLYEIVPRLTAAFTARRPGGG